MSAHTASPLSEGQSQLSPGRRNSVQGLGDCNSGQGQGRGGYSLVLELVHRKWDSELLGSHKMGLDLLELRKMC